MKEGPKKITIKHIGMIQPFHTLGQFGVLTSIASTLPNISFGLWMGGKVGNPTRSVCHIYNRDYCKQEFIKSSQKCSCPEQSWSLLKFQSLVVHLNHTLTKIFTLFDLTISAQFRTSLVYTNIRQTNNNK